MQLLTTVSCKLLDTVRCSLSGLPGGAGWGPHAVAPPARVIGHVACLLCEHCVQCLALSRDTEGGLEAIIGSCCVPCSILQVSCEFLHAHPILVRSWDAFLQTQEEMLPPQSPHWSWTPSLQCRIWGCVQGGYMLGSRDRVGKSDPLLTFVYVCQVPVCFTTQAWHSFRKVSTFLF